MVGSVVFSAALVILRTSRRNACDRWGRESDVLGHGDTIDAQAVHRELTACIVLAIACDIATFGELGLCV